jgi:hypothetical protein
MITRAASLTCTPAELAFLAGLLGLPALVGIPDPFWGRLAREIEQALAEARHSLVDRNIILVNKDETLTVAPDVAGLVRACGRPERTYFVTEATPGAGPASRVVHLHALGLVEAVPEGAAVTLTTLPDSGALYDQMVTLARIGGQNASPVPAGRLPPGILQEARLQADEDGPGAAASLLERAGLAPETARALAQTLAAPVAGLSMAMAVPGLRGWNVEGMGLLTGTERIWLIREGPDHTLVQDCTPDTARAALADLLFRV